MAPRTLNNETHGFVYRDGATIDIGTLGGTSSQALGINDAGLVVGTSATYFAGGASAFLFDGENLFNLNDLIDRSNPATMCWQLTSAAAINDLGQILVNGYDTRGFIPMTFVLTPVPLPAALWLFAPVVALLMPGSPPLDTANIGSALNVTNRKLGGSPRRGEPPTSHDCHEHLAH